MNYTEKDLKSFKCTDSGFLLCPSGNYTSIKEFEDDCLFEKHCIFGKDTKFGDNCIFRDYCKFEERTRFGNHCRFGQDCVFEAFCIFGHGCYFEKYNYFGYSCEFGNSCEFETNCIFSISCSFGEKIRFNKPKFREIPDIVDRIIKINNIGYGDNIYFFKTPYEIYVSGLCFFGTIERFEQEMSEIYKNDKRAEKEYVETMKYIKTILCYVEIH